MTSYSKLSSQEKATINIKGILNYNYYILHSAVQNILQHNNDESLHTDVNSLLERCIKDLDNILLNHSKSNENKTKNSHSEDA